MLIRITKSLIIVCFTLIASTSSNANAQVRNCPNEFKSKGFYSKYLDAKGIPVLSSSRVSNKALVTAKQTILKMLSNSPDLLKELAKRKVRVAIIGKSEMTTNIPEHADLYQVFPNKDWNKETRGVGATKERPVCSCGEENLLKLNSDRYKGENILIHEFAHTILTMGIDYTDPGFRKRLAVSYKAAKQKGLWKGTYAISNVEEYWAEGVQFWFNANMSERLSDGKTLRTRQDLIRYDPTLAKLIASVFGNRN